MSRTDDEVLLLVGTLADAEWCRERLETASREAVRADDLEEAVSVLEDGGVAGVVVGDCGDLTGLECAGSLAESGGKAPVVVVTDRAVPDGVAESLGVADVLPARGGDGPDRERLEAALATSSPSTSPETADWEVLQQLSEITADPTATFDAKVEAVLDLGCRYLGVSTGFLTHITDGVQTITHATGPASTIEDGSTAPLEESYCRRTLDRGETVCVSDVASAGWDGDPAVERFGLGCYAGTPITVRGRQHGTFCFADDEPRTSAFTDSERTFVELLGQWAAYELDRRERERELRRMSRAIEAAPVGISISDADSADNEISYVNEEFEQLTGYDQAEVVGRNCRFLQGEETAAEAVTRLREGIEARQPVEVELRNYRKDGTKFWNRVTVAPVEDDDGTVTNFVGFQQDITERKRYQRALTSLHRTTRELIQSRDDREVTRRVAEAGNAVIQVAGTAVYLFDDEQSTLEPMAVAGSLRTAGGTLPDVNPDREDAVWSAFVDRETTVCRDGVPPGGRIEQLPFESGAYIPLGDHGLVVIVSREPDGIDETTVELGELLAANAEAALDRLDRESAVRERDEKLQRRANRLQQLDEVNERVRKITHDLIGARTQTEIGETVCQGLTTGSRFEMVSFAETTRHGDGVRVECWGGTESGYFDAVELGASGQSQSEPTVRAATTGEVVVVDNVASDLRDGDWRREALSRGYQSVVSVPIVHGGVPYGVVSVYGNEPHVFDEETREVLAELGETMGHAMETITQRRALTSDRKVELEFTLDGETPLLAFTDRTGCELTVERVLPNGETYLAYGTVAGLDAEAFEAAVTRAVGIEDGRILSETADGFGVELQLGEPTVTQCITDHGGVFKRLAADDGHGTVSMVFPASATVSDFVSVFADRYDTATLIARRELDRTGDTADRTTLTDRQRQVLEVAFNSGFFDWPRESTGEEIADSLGISAPTLQEHLRRAERKVLGQFLGDDTRHEGSADRS